MPTPSGTCALCRNERELRDSHFLPKSLYRQVRATEGDVRSPIIIDSERAKNTDRQIKKYLLCGECEQEFSKSGENWTMSQILQQTGVFPLLAALDSHSPTAEQGSNRLYACADVPEIDTTKLTYFALSVFWRGAVTDWIIDGQRIEPLALDPSTVESVRAYLNGEAGIPQNIALVMNVCDSPSLAATTLATPVGHAGGYLFLVPGLAFHLFVGGAVSPAMSAASICGASKGILLRSNYEEFIKAAFFAKMRTAAPSSALKAFTEPPKPESGSSAS